MSDLTEEPDEAADRPGGPLAVTDCNYVEIATGIHTDSIAVQLHTPPTGRFMPQIRSQQTSRENISLNPLSFLSIHREFVQNKTIYKKGVPLSFFLSFLFFFLRLFHSLSIRVQRTRSIRSRTPDKCACDLLSANLNQKRKNGRTTRALNATC